LSNRHFQIGVFANMVTCGNKKTRPLKVPALIQGGVIVSFALAALVFAAYMFGSLPDQGFSDETQFLLLRIARYLSLSLTVFSLCALGFSVRLLVRKPRFRHFLGMALYTVTGILGAALTLLHSFIMVAAGGNG
jgi:hypothetical protein